MTFAAGSAPSSQINKVPIKIVDAGALTFDWHPITMSHDRVSSVAPGWRTAAPAVVHDVICDKGPPGWRAFVPKYVRLSAGHHQDARSVDLIRLQALKRLVGLLQGKSGDVRMDSRLGCLSQQFVTVLASIRCH